MNEKDFMVAPDNCIAADSTVCLACLLLGKDTLRYSVEQLPGKAILSSYH